MIMTLYKILGVPTDVNPESLKRAYRRKAKRYHPDTNPGDPNASKKFNIIHHAYTILSDPQRRKLYDAKLAAQAQAAPPASDARSEEKDPETKNGEAASQKRDEADQDQPAKGSPSLTPTDRRFDHDQVRRGFWYTAGVVIVLIFMLEIFNHIQFIKESKSFVNLLPKQAAKLPTIEYFYPPPANKTSPAVPVPVFGPPPQASPPSQRQTPTAVEPLKILEHPSAGTLVLIPAGDFLMGSLATAPKANHNEFPQHKVRIASGFLMGSREVTRAQFRVFVAETGYQTEAETDGIGGWGYDRSTRKFNRPWPRYSWKETGFEEGDRHPVVNVSWNDAAAFCRWLTTRDGARLFRLPTEAEWEYACRAGLRTVYAFGDDPKSLDGMENVGDQSLVGVLARGPGEVGLIDQAAPWKDRHEFSAEVGSYRPNQFGLFDMHGNVCEWVQDWYDEAGYTVSKETDGERTGTERVIRGGCWGYGPANSRAASRHHFPPSERWCNLGFRVVAVPPIAPPLTQDANHPPDSKSDGSLQTSVENDASAPRKSLASASDHREQAEHLHQQGAEFLRKGEKDKAIAMFSAAITIDNMHIKSYIQRSVALLQKRDYDAAVADCTEAIRRDPRSGDAYFQRGEVYMFKTDHEKALSDFSNAIKFNDRSKYRDSRGWLYLVKGRRQEAMADLNRAIEMNPAQAFSYFHRGILYGQQGKLDRALVDFDKAIRLDPRSADAYFYRSRLYQGMGDARSSAADRRRALEINPALGDKDPDFLNDGRPPGPNRRSTRAR